MPAVVHGVVLAAGRSDRAGGPKALAELSGETFVARAVRVLGEGGCEVVWVVVGAPFGERVRRAASPARVIENPDPSRGMLSSLQTGLCAALEATPAPTALVFSLVDHPRVGSAVVEKLIARQREAPCDAIRPRYGGKPGHPVLISASVARKLLGAPVETTVRDALAEVARIEDLDVDDPAIIDDADNADEIRAIGGKFPDD